MLEPLPPGNARIDVDGDGVSVAIKSTNADGPSPPQPSADHVFNAFKRAFGSDLDALERDWHHFMKNVQTPLEQNAPTADATAKPKPQPARGKT